MKQLLKCLMVTLWLYTGLVYAGRPLETDDAAVTGQNTCQLDFWNETTANTRQDNFNGGCNFFGPSELSLSLGARHGDADDAHVKGFGYKHIVREFDDHRVGYGFAISTSKDYLPSQQSTRETLATGIATVPLGSDDFVMHLNLGYLRFNGLNGKDERPFAAAALDYQWTSRVGLSIETFNGAESSLSWRLGARYAIVPDFFQIDASYGSDYGQFSAARALTIGIGITPSF